MSPLFNYKIIGNKIFKSFKSGNIDQLGEIKLIETSSNGNAVVYYDNKFGPYLSGYGIVNTEMSDIEIERIYK